MLLIGRVVGIAAIRMHSHAGAWERGEDYLCPSAKSADYYVYPQMTQINADKSYRRRWLDNAVPTFSI